MIARLVLRSSLSITIFAVDWFAFSWFEWNFAFITAL